MHITRRDVLRRLAGIGTAALLLVSTNFVLDNDMSSVVAGRQVFNDGLPNVGNGLRNGGTAPGRLRQTTTTVASGTTAITDASTTSLPSAPTSEPSTSTSPTTAVVTPTTTVAPTTTATPTTTTTTTATTEPPRTVAGDKFTILLRRSGDDLPSFWWNAPYIRSLPYASNTGWVDGDRVGYKCAYMFLMRDEQIVGRVTFAAIREATYGKINDQSMDERERYFDGTPNPSDTNMGDCTRSDVAYEPSDGPDERPTLKFMAGSQLLEIRDYKPTVVGAGITFDQVEVISQPFVEVSALGIGATVYSRITVVAREHGLPVVVVYYDSLDPSVRLTSDLS